MTYIKIISDGSHEFQGLVNMVKEISGSHRANYGYNLRSNEIASEMFSQYGIKVGDFDHNTGTRSIDFGSESNYLLFLLQW